MELDTENYKLSDFKNIFNKNSEQTFITRQNSKKPFFKIIRFFNFFS